MLFSTLRLLYGAAALISVVFADDCESTPETPIAPGGRWEGRPIDKEGGTYFCETRWKSGAVVTGIRAWSVDAHIKGILLSYSDGTEGELHGSKDGGREGDNNFLNWDSGAVIDSIWIAGNWNEGQGADGVGKININVKGGEKFNVESDVGTFKGVRVENTGKVGKILGIRGKQGQWLEAIEFLMLRDGVQTTVELVDIKFDKSAEDWENKKDNIDDILTAQVYIPNNNDNGAEKEYTFKRTESTKYSRTFSQSNEFIFGSKVGFKMTHQIGVPTLASTTIEGSVEFSWQRSWKNSVDTTEEDSSSTEWWEKGTLKPGRAILCKSSSIKGSFSDNYMATLEMTVNVNVDGKVKPQVFRLEQPGKFNSVNFVEASSECRDIPVKEVPKDAKEITDEGPAAGDPVTGIPFKG